MKILISSYYLDLSGTPTYTKTLYDELCRRGHDVTVYSPALGYLAKHMHTIQTLACVGAPDIILAQQNVCAEDMRRMFPATPMIFSAHGLVPQMEQPPDCWVDWYTAINEDVRDNLIRRRVDACKIDIVRDFVDTDKFRPVEPVCDRLRNVLYISNFKKWKTYDIIAGACRKVGASLKAIGSPYGRSYNVEQDINRADLVVSIARGLLEGMACGRPVVSFDQRRGDGYLSPERYVESRRGNFVGAIDGGTAFDVESLARELDRYKSGDGAVNRAIAIDHHGHVAGVDRMLGIIKKVTGK